MFYCAASGRSIAGRQAYTFFEKQQQDQFRRRRFLDNNLVVYLACAPLFLLSYSNSIATMRLRSPTNTLNVRQAAPVSMTSNPMPARRN
jgi:hypothetical protein